MSLGKNQKPFRFLQFSRILSKPQIMIVVAKRSPVSNLIKVPFLVPHISYRTGGKKLVCYREDSHGLAG